MNISNREIAFAAAVIFNQRIVWGADYKTETFICRWISSHPKPKVCLQQVFHYVIKCREISQNKQETLNFSNTSL